MLMLRLQKLFGLKGDALQWLCSYFSNRRQRIIIGNRSSSALPLTTGVPQGSVVGPGTFPAYTKPLGDMVRTHDVDLHLYADDTQLYLGVHLPDANITKIKLETCVGEVRKWMAANMLKLNDGKTEYMVMGSNHMMKHIPPCLNSISIGNSIISKATSARNIGVIMDETLSMEHQVNNICRSCYLSIRNISRIRPYLTEETTKQLVIAYVISKLDYNNALLYKMNKKYLKKLQRIQDVCARLVMNTRTGVSTEYMKKALHWLPVEQRIIFKINLLTYICLNHDAPQYLQDLLAVEQLGRSTRSESTCRLKESLVRKDMVTEPLEMLHHRSGIIYLLKSASAPQSTCLNANLRLTCLKLPSTNSNIQTTSNCFYMFY